MKKQLLTLAQFNNLNNNAKKDYYENSIVPRLKNQKANKANWEVSLNDAIVSGDAKSLLRGAASCKPFFKWMTSESEVVEEKGTKEILIEKGLSAPIAAKLADKTIEELKAMSKEDLVSLNGVGEKTADTIFAIEW